MRCHRRRRCHPYFPLATVLAAVPAQKTQVWWARSAAQNPGAFLGAVFKRMQALVCAGNFVVLAIPLRKYPRQSRIVNPAFRSAARPPVPLYALLKI